MKIYNLTNHLLTTSQLSSLRELYPVAELIASPQGISFEDVHDRMAWADEWSKKLDGNVAIVGGDTAVFMMLMKKCINKDVTFLAAQTERSMRDENDRFIFIFKGWIVFKGDE